MIFIVVVSRKKKRKKKRKRREIQTRRPRRLQREGKGRSFSHVYSLSLFPPPLQLSPFIMSALPQSTNIFQVIKELYPERYIDIIKDLHGVHFRELPYHIGQQIHSHRINLIKYELSLTAGYHQSEEKDKQLDYYLLRKGQQPFLIDDDFQIGMAMCFRHGQHLEYLSPALRKNKAIVLTAVQNTWLAFKYVRDALTNDPDILMKVCTLSDGYLIVMMDLKLLQHPLLEFVDAKVRPHEPSVPILEGSRVFVSLKANSVRNRNESQ